MVDPTNNWIHLHRNLLMNELWKSEPFTKGQAWVDLLLSANWKSGIAIIKGIQVPVGRGQTCRAMKQLAIRWKWSEGKVKRYLDLLQDLEQIAFKNWSKNGAQNGAQKNCITTLITIINYDFYQHNEAGDEAETERKRSANGAQTELYKKLKKEKNKPSPELLDCFEKLWERYPRQKEKPSALKHFLRTVKTVDDARRVWLALNKYIEETEGVEMKYIKLGSTWFNNWQDWEATNGEV